MPNKHCTGRDERQAWIWSFAVKMNENMINKSLENQSLTPVS